jgi:hypothetical protein
VSDDWEPTGLATSTVLRLETTGVPQICGVACRCGRQMERMADGHGTRNFSCPCGQVCVWVLDQ